MATKFEIQKEKDLQDIDIELRSQILKILKSGEHDKFIHLKEVIRYLESNDKAYAKNKRIEAVKNDETQTEEDEYLSKLEQAKMSRLQAEKQYKVKNGKK